MANLFRIVGLWLFPLYVFAQPTCTLYSVPHFSAARAVVDLPSPSAAAASYISRWNTALNSAPNNCNSSGQSNHTSYVVTLVSVAPNSASFVVNIQTSRFNWQPSGDVMVCASGQVTQETDTVNISNRQGPCPVPDPVAAFCSSVAGSPVVNYQWRTSTPSLGPQTVCSETTQAGLPRGCADQLYADFCAFYDGSYTCTGSGVRGAGTCTLSTTPQNATTTVSGTSTVPGTPTVWPEAPPKGRCPGQVNGITVLVPCSGTVTSVTTVSGTTTSPSSGGSSTTSIVATSTSTQFVCSGSSCTSTTTVNGPGGATQTVVSGSKDAICAGSSSLACSDGEEASSSSFSGACSSGFVCEGDAVQCAIAREQHTRNCSVWDGTSSERSLYDTSKVLTGNQTTNLPDNASFSVGPGSFDQSNSIGGAGSGMSDVSLTVAGSSVTLPFSRVNPFLSALGNVMLAVSFLLAARIVTRG